MLLLLRRNSASKRRKSPTFLKQQECRVGGLSAIKAMVGRKRKLQRRTSLTVKMWTEWVKFVGTKCGPRIAAVFDFSYRFGLRASEVLRLKRGAICLADATLYIRVKSTQASLGAHDQWLKDVLKRGYRVQRMRRHKYVEECFKIKEDGYIFTSGPGAKNKHLHYQAIQRHCKIQVPQFLKYLKDNGKNWSNDLLSFLHLYLR